MTRLGDLHELETSEILNVFKKVIILDPQSSWICNKKRSFWSNWCPEKLNLNFIRPKVLFEVSYRSGFGNVGKK